MKKCCKDYFIYFLGELTELRFERFPDSIFWKSDKFGTVFELDKKNEMWMRHDFFKEISKFFVMDRNQTKEILKEIINEHLDLDIVSLNPAGYLELF